jgi:nitrous oxidase accessory protein
MAARRAEVSRSGVFLSIYAAALLVVAMKFPWWRMECRAPQYGMRVLTIDVGPLKVAGDIKELDGLGHFVGMRTIDTFAPLERSIAPYALALVVAIALSLPFLRWRWARIAAALAVVAVPVGFMIDLWAWQRFAVTHLDPHAPLNMIANRIQAQLFGDYAIAQFKVLATFQTGFWLVVVAAALAVAFAVGEWRLDVRVPKKLVTASAVAAIVLFGSSSADAATLDVGGSFPFPRIGDAIGAASAGDEIVVHPGVFHEHVVVDRALVVRGTPGAIVDGDGGGTIVLVTAGPSTISGLALRNGGDDLLDEDAGIKVKSAADVVVEDDRIDDTLFGILVIASPNAKILRNHVVGLDLPITRRGDGIRVFASNGTTIEDDVVERSRDLAVWQSNHVDARRNAVRGSRYGLHYMYCDDSAFEDNVFEDDQVGAAIMYSRRLTLRRNRFAHARGPSAHGLLVKVADDLVVERNAFVDDTRGIFLEDTPSSIYAKVTFRWNVVAGNDVGVSLTTSVAGVVFTENAFIANRLSAEARGRVREDQNAWSLDGRGNYWSDYVGFDSDGDGIGDTPYRAEHFFESLSDRWPAVGLLRFGPGADALELAARAFPIMAPRAIVVDDRPLLRPPAELPVAPAGTPSVGLAVGGIGLAAGAMWLVGRARRSLGGAS